MYINYTISYKSCPHCGKVLKYENTLSYLALGIITLGAPIFATNIISDIFKYDREKMGNPIKPCKRCKKLVNLGKKKEWYNMSLLEKKSWAFRKWINLSVLLGSLCIFIVPAPVFIFFIYLIYKKWIKLLDKAEVVVSQNDYQLIKASYKRCTQRGYIFEETNKIEIKETGIVLQDYTQEQ